MTSPGQPAFPRVALDWLTPTGLEQSARLLVVGRSTAPVAAALAADGRALVAVDASRAGLRTLLARAPRALPVVAQPTRLPFVPTAFDAVYLHQCFHLLPASAVLAECARVLVPDGCLALSWTTRDDSVPWVRRLIALMRAVDPGAMAGDYGTEAAGVLADNPFFYDVEHRSHRLWVPISRVDLLEMVANRFPDLPNEELSGLMGRVGALYESSARVPEPLLLPYQVACWRARVDHTEFTSQLRLPDDGLPIHL